MLKSLTGWLLTTMIQVLEKLIVDRFTNNFFFYHWNTYWQYKAGLQNGE
jgi:hypothetical protein